MHFACARRRLLERWSQIQTPKPGSSLKLCQLSTHLPQVALFPAPAHAAGAAEVAWHSQTGILRTDLQGGLFAGTKTLKLQSILNSTNVPLKAPWWVVGSLQGNHVVSAVSAIRQAVPHAPVRVVALGRSAQTGDPPTQYQGNELLLRMLVPAEDIFSMRGLLGAQAASLCAPRAAIRDAAKAAQTGSTSLEMGANGAICSFNAAHSSLPIVWEGGAQPAGVRGAASLAPMVLQGLASMRCGATQTEAHRGSQDVQEHVAIDAGTGCTAASLVAQLALDGATALAIHVVLVAGTPEGFKHMLRLAVAELCSDASACLSSLELHDHTESAAPHAAADPTTGAHHKRAAKLHVHLHRPPTAKSFGSVNSTAAKSAVALSRATGVLLDPVYTSKLLQTVLHLQDTEAWQSKQQLQRWLVVHGGGAGGLLGHAAALSKAVRALDE